MREVCGNSIEGTNEIPKEINQNNKKHWIEFPKQNLKSLTKTKPPSKPPTQMKMSTHEDDDLDHDQEEINVDDVDSDSRISYGSNASDIDLDGNGSCYDDSETAIR